ncbi:thymidine kinase [Paenibacillus polymyxa]
MSDKNKDFFYGVIGSGKTFSDSSWLRYAKNILEGKCEARSVKVDKRKERRLKRRIGRKVKLMILDEGQRLFNFNDDKQKEYLIRGHIVTQSLKDLME